MIDFRDNVKSFEEVRQALQRIRLILRQYPQYRSNAEVAPTATDDSTAGFHVGSFWLDNFNGQAYILEDPTPGAAVWTNLTQIVFGGTPPDPGGGVAGSAPGDEKGRLRVTDEDGRFDLAEPTKKEIELLQNIVENSRQKVRVAIRRRRLAESADAR